MPYKVAGTLDTAIRTFKNPFPFRPSFPYYCPLNSSVINDIDYEIIPEETLTNYCESTREFCVTETVNNDDSHWDNTVLRIDADGANNSTNIVDSSKIIKPITRNQNPVISTAQSKYGGSSLLLPSDNGRGVTSTDNTANHLIIQSNLNLTGTGNFTIEAWVYLTTDSTVNVIFTSSSDFRLDYAINLTITSGKLRANYFFSNNIVGSEMIGSSTLSLNTWYHVALTRSGNTHKLWVNGVEDATATLTTSLTNSQNKAIVGARTTTFSGNPNIYQYGGFRGYIDSLRVTQGIARYSSNFNAETDTFLNTTVTEETVCTDFYDFAQAP